MSAKIYDYTKICKSILSVDPKIRFAGVINQMGRIVTGKFKEGVSSYLDDKEDGMAYMELAMEIFLREEFNEKLGEVEYVLSKRKKINIISIPMKKYLILISSEPDANVEEVLEKTKQVFGKIL